MIFEKKAAEQAKCLSERAQAGLLRLLLEASPTGKVSLEGVDPAILDELEDVGLLERRGRQGKLLGLAPQRSRQLDLDELPDSWRTFPEAIQAAQRGVDLEAEFERFRLYHESKGSTMRDWGKAWRTWVSRAYPSRQEAKRVLGAAIHRATGLSSVELLMRLEKGEG
jgi:hypothetical protein